MLIILQFGDDRILDKAVDPFSLSLLLMLLQLSPNELHKPKWFSLTGEVVSVSGDDSMHIQSLEVL